MQRHAIAARLSEPCLKRLVQEKGYGGLNLFRVGQGMGVRLSKSAEREELRQRGRARWGESTPGSFTGRNRHKKKNCWSSLLVGKDLDQVQRRTP